MSSASDLSDGSPRSAGSTEAAEAPESEASTPRGPIDFEDPDLEAPPSCLGDGGLASLHTIAKFGSAFDGTIGSILQRLEALEGRVAGAETRIDAKIEEVNQKIDTLTHNIQGFAEDNAEAIAREREALEKYKADLKRKTKLSMEAVANSRQGAARAARRARERAAAAAARAEAERLAEAAAEAAADADVPPPPAPPPPEFGYRDDGTPRNPGAMRRWRWAMRKLKMRRVFARIPMGAAKADPNDSLGARLKKAEGALDDLLYRLGGVEAANGGPGDQALKDEMRRLGQRQDETRELVEALEDARVATTSRLDAVTSQTGDVSALAADTSVLVDQMVKLREGELTEARALEEKFPAMLERLETLARDAGYGTTLPRVKASTASNYLEIFAKDLLGEDHVISSEDDPVEDDGALYEADGLADDPRAKRVERLAWACHRLLEADRDGRAKASSDPTFAPNFAPLDAFVGRDNKPRTSVGPGGAVGLDRTSTS